ncbi:phage tail domain-containing protein [Virgibacillus sp. SK37]|uniref:phage tail domain-containing protein n=1 Tax=Virgibacillus sp. SK37 TaxID=403957 RepID=UPI0004D0B254|nr:phage tail domain-containing protein [Virgibacillus sp. SK37]AIF43437.1 hypothetical protein X953_10050 [Virgibacillus sp. SK37]
MRHETHFNFDGKWSYDMGVSKVNIGGGLFEDLIVSSKQIMEEKIEGRDRPYFYGVDKEPLSFPLPIYFDDNLSNEKIREILRWLNHDDYRPFYMIDDHNRRWYVMITDNATAIHNGIKSGYMELNLRTDSPTTLTPFTKSKLYRFENNVNGELINFENRGDFKCKPIVHILKRGKGDISIKNMSNNTGEFKITGLDDQEQVTVDCEYQEINSSANKFRYDSFSKKYLSFVRGVNRLKIVGDCDIWFETEFKVY